MNKRFRKDKVESDFIQPAKLIWWKRLVEAQESRIVTESRHDALWSFRTVSEGTSVFRHVKKGEEMVA